MKALITGGSGFVGSWLVRDLCRRGLDVRILCRRPEAVQEFKGFPVELALGDLSSRDSLVKACQGMDWVFHLGGLVAYSKEKRAAMEEVNVKGTMNMLMAAHQNRVKRFLHMSSVTAIGASFDGEALNEQSDYNLTHLDLGYFETKRRAEGQVMEACREGMVDVVVVNPSTIYGAGDALKGSRSTQIKVAKGKFPFYTGGGVNVIAIEDVIGAIWEAMNRGKTGERYILGGENLLIKDLFRIIAEEAGVSPPSIYLPNFVVHGIGRMGDLLEKWG
ncbi:MAG: NAD-dependent epimerase/dehydratase family protein, partial [Bdellovibrionales bacterium]|nr:NAD-dependent epimerase/dehydratase family protein [Bdellovibrionales bacterium]